MMRASLLLIAALWLGGCENWHNRIDNQILNCGDAVRGSTDLWIKILDPEGSELPSDEELDARDLQVDEQGALPPPLRVSEKHCVRVSSLAAVVVRSRQPNRSWSVLIHADKLPWDHRVHLEDSSQQQVRLQCPNPWVNDGRMLLPLVTSGVNPEALALSTSLDGPDGRRSTGGFGLQSQTKPIVWPVDWPDGNGRLVLLQQNLLQSLVPKQETCDLEIDRVRPSLELTPAPDAEGNLDLRPGSLLRIRVVDAHPGLLRWCLGQGAQCSDESGWSTATGEVSVSIPDKGRWNLEARAVDAAGNSSDRLNQPIDVIQADLIQTIGARVDQALSESYRDGLKARQSLLQALDDYKKLVLDKEQKLIKNKLVDGILQAAPSIQERGRSVVEGSARRVWALNDRLDSPWLVLTASELSLWTRTGTLLNKIAVTDAATADWSATQQALVLAGFDQMQVIAVVDSSLELRASVNWTDIPGFEFGAADVKWIPQASQLVVAMDARIPLIFDYRPGALTLRKRLDLEYARQAAVSPAGDVLAVAATDQVSIWRKGQDDWEFVRSDFRFVLDLRFTSDNKLLVLSSDGDLTSWSPGSDWSVMDSGTPNEKPKPMPDSPAPVYLQSWADGASGVFERGGRMYQWSSDPGKALQQVTLQGGFNWEQMQQWKLDTCRKGLWTLDDRTLSFWQFRDNGEPTFVKAGEWPQDPDFFRDFVGNCNVDDREFITLDVRRGRLRFWSQHGPLPTVWDGDGSIVVSRFQPGLPSGEALFVAGFGGIIRAWDLTAKKLQEFVGHKGQVNEMRFLPERNQYASSAEDGSVRLWSIAGQAMANLPATKPASNLRDSSLLIDPDHLLSAGSRAITIWSRQLDSWVLTITIPLISNERPGFDSVVRLPARAATAATITAAAASPATGSLALNEGARVLVKVRKSSWRGLFINAAGAVQLTEPGLPILEQMQRIEWTADGTRLALIDAPGVLKIFRAEGEGWVQEALNFPSGKVQQLTFAPDGRSFAVRLDNALQIWEFNNRSWAKSAETQLEETSGFDQGLVWSADSQHIIYAQTAMVRLHDRRLKLEHQFQSFPEQKQLSSLGVSVHPDYFAVGLDSQVRIIDLNLERLEAALRVW